MTFLGPLCFLNFVEKGNRKDLNRCLALETMQFTVTSTSYEFVNYSALAMESLSLTLFFLPARKPAWFGLEKKPVRTFTLIDHLTRSRPSLTSPSPRSPQLKEKVLGGGVKHPRMEGRGSVPPSRGPERQLKAELGPRRVDVLSVSQEGEFRSP